MKLSSKPSQILFFLRISLACLFFQCSGPEKSSNEKSTRNFQFYQGAIVRGDTTFQEIALVFTGDEFADGGPVILETLRKHQIKASFFFTGNFYRNPEFKNLIENLIAEGHYVGAHSDQHLLYCAWENRDSLLVSKEGFERDLSDNYLEMEKFKIGQKDAPFFLPPFEWFNDSISKWTQNMGFQLINFTSGTLSHADYTTPDLQNYRNNSVILQSIWDLEEKQGLNGFLLLSHIGVSPARPDKFYQELDELIEQLKLKNICSGESMRCFNSFQIFPYADFMSQFFNLSFRKPA